jgi:subtilisin-like proprotein convertase family protein
LKMENGEWRMENGEWRIENLACVLHFQFSIFNSQLPIHCLFSAKRRKARRPWREVLNFAPASFLLPIAHVFHNSFSMRSIFLSFLLLASAAPLFAQRVAPNFFQPIGADAVAASPASARPIQPRAFRAFRFDFAAANALLQQAPMEWSAAARQQPVTLTLPLADGSARDFQVWESPVMAPALAAKYPAIRTYAGKAADGSGLTVRLGTSHKGFHAFVFSPDETAQVLRPYATDNAEIYMAYRVADLPQDEYNASRCGVDDAHEIEHSLGENLATERSAEPVNLKKYRLAVTAQAEYSLFHGGTKPLVMSAIVEAMNYITAIQERDWSVRLELIPNNDTLIYFDPLTDPFSGSLIPQWIGDNPGAINPLIGNSNYDIGHLFSRVANPSGIYVAGQAQIAGVCAAIDKAVAGSSQPNPVGEGFYKIIAHEMGHQFSATHTFNNCPPSAGAVTEGTAYEPGSGSTLMSYAGTCNENPGDPNNNVQNSDDPYFHIANLLQVQNFITQGNGATCPVVVETGNNAPEASTSIPNNFFIPIGTPFQLSGSATDADGDPLTYTWEQYDLGPPSTLGSPSVDAPSFRSFPPTASPTRTFPQLSTILGNGSSTREVLPTANRQLTFRMTARDNHPGSGAFDWVEVKFRSTAAAGPFRVTAPNASTDTWAAGSYQTVTWDVANTNVGQVNCKTVNVLLSLNGGNTFNTVLAAGVPNIGRCCILVPNIATPAARIRVEAADNVFFDLSNFNFSIITDPSAPSISLCASAPEAFACLPGNFSTTISTSGVGNATDPISLSASGLPAGAEATFNPNPVAPGGMSTMTITFPNNALESTFDVTIAANADTLEATTLTTLTVVNNNFAAFGPQTPADGAIGVNPSPALYWNAVPDADFYDVELASDPSFAAGTVLATKSNTPADSFQIASPLAAGQVYYWRVRAQNDCGETTWSEPFVFSTGIQSCSNFVATDLPKVISANGTPTVESKITVNGSATLSDVNVTKIQGNHQFFKDLEVRLIGPSGTNVLLWKDKCASNSNFNLGMDDGFATQFSCPPPNNGSASKPTEALAAFNGQNTAGVWTLRVKDNTISSGGTLSGFELQLCSSVSLNPPSLLTNSPLVLPSGSNAPITESLLNAEDANNGPAQLTYTLVTLPQNGYLANAGGVLQVGGKFTQSDINSGAVRYYDFGLALGNDDFRFALTDGEGGLVTGTFLVQPTVGIGGPAQGDFAFDLAPNPANESVRILLGTPLASDARVALFNTTGQLLRTWSLAAGATTMLLEISALPEGVYAVTLENEQGKAAKKVVVR